MCVARTCARKRKQMKNDPRHQQGRKDPSKRALRTARQLQKQRDMQLRKGSK